MLNHEKLNKSNYINIVIYADRKSVLNVTLSNSELIQNTLQMLEQQIKDIYEIQKEQNKTNEHSLSQK